MWLGRNARPTKENKMKRTVIALFLVLLLIFTFAACKGNEPDNSDKDTNAGTDSSSGTTCTRHVYGEWEVVTPATCFEKGLEARYCLNCDLKISRLSDKAPHDSAPMPDVAATCYLDGSTGGMRCKVCSAITEQPTTISKETAHKLDTILSESHPNFSSAGKGKFECSICKTTVEKTYDKLSPHVLTKNDIYSVEFNNDYNPAKDNGYMLFDGNTNTPGIFSTGSDWFGYVGDTITITFKNEIIIKDLYVYLAGNDTYGEVSIINTSGGKNTYRVNATQDSYGGDGQEVKIFTDKAYSIIQIQIKVTGIKWDDYRTFKVSELKVNAAPRVGELSHKHQSREDAQVVTEATCSSNGKTDRYCWCGGIYTWNTAKVDHKYNTYDEEKSVKATCISDGKTVYKCQWCTRTVEETVKSKGHVYAKLIECTATPTTSSQGKGTFMCVGCNLTQEKTMAALAIEEINHLRVSQIGTLSVTLKFNIYGEAPSYEVRYSTSEITSSNFNSATLVNATVTGTREITAVIPLSVGTGSYYVAIRPYSGTNYGEIKYVRVGGADKEIPIDYEKATVYSGEVLNSFAYLFDNNTETRLSKIFNNSTADQYDGTNLQGTNLSPIIDLEYEHYVSKIRLYYGTDTGKSVKVRWSETPVDFMAEDSAWDGVASITTASGWNDVTIGVKTRYIQIIFKDGEAPYEVEAYGYQSGEGDEIATEIKNKPTIGQMMGMCGFVAIGSGNTPVDSVICSTVLREYHNFGWSYVANNYGGKASVFNWSMGNFDEKYLEYRSAGINVIPCIQWQIGQKQTISYKVDSNGNPLRLNGELIRATFWERFDPDTYFVYADNVFAFAARYGSNNSSELYAIASQQTAGTTVVGANVIEWIELGNEPDGSWNGINHYSSAYQLAAATSAAYDGHCATMKQQLSNGYHLGGKNADPNIKLALAGVSGVANEYITAICYWQKANRADGKTAFDAFNVHQYMSKAIEIDGYTVYVGMSPEEANLKGTLSQLVSIRNKYYPEKEVWITEFGWDTNQSYATVNSAHAYGNYTGRQVQAMWLTRAYLILSSMGIDKATMYMCEDTGIEEEAVGKFGSSGVIGYEYDANGNVKEVKKDSYYYLYTLKNTLGDYTFYREIESYDENVMIYEYKNYAGKSAYAAWCKTSDGTVSENYQLMIDGSKATLVENVYGDIDGVKTSLVADEFGYVTINVSENPVYVVVE